MKKSVQDKIAANKAKSDLKASVEQAKNEAIALNERNEKGQFISKKSDEFKQIRKRRVEKTISQVGDILEATTYEDEEGDTISIRMLKSLVRGIIEGPDEKGGLNAKANAWDKLTKALGVGEIDKDESAQQNMPVTIIITPPAGIKAEPARKVEALRQPSWMLPAPVVDAEMVSQNAPTNQDKTEESDKNLCFLSMTTEQMLAKIRADEAAEEQKPADEPAASEPVAEPKRTLTKEEALENYDPHRGLKREATQ